MKEMIIIIINRVNDMIVLIMYNSLTPIFVFLKFGWDYFGIIMGFFDKLAYWHICGSPLYTNSDLVIF